MKKITINLGETESNKTKAERLREKGRENEKPRRADSSRERNQDVKRVWRG